MARNRLKQRQCQELVYGREQDLDVKCRNYQIGLASLTISSCCGTGVVHVPLSVQIRVLPLFLAFYLIY